MTDIKPLHRRMRAKCKVCKEVFVTQKRLRVRQTCSEECYVKLQEAIKNEPIECAMCLEPMERVYGNRQRRTCSEKCRKRLIASHQNAQRNNSGRFVDDDGEQGPNDPSPDEIQVMAQEIKRRNLEMKRLGIETRRD